MGKKKINARRKQEVQFITDNSETKKIKLDLGDTTGHGKEYDDSNALVIPSKKRLTKAQFKEKKVTRILSKKQRKNLEKIVDKKLKKQNRSTLLENLSSVQLPADQVKQLVSITQVQTSGLRKFSLVGDKVLSQDGETQSAKKLSSIAGSRKRKLLERLQEDSDVDSDDPKSNCQQTDGFYSSSDDSDDEISSETKEIPKQRIEISKNFSFTVEDVDEKGKCEGNGINSTENSFTVSDLEAQGSRINGEPPVKPPSKPAVYIHLERKPEIQAARLKLPILGEEQVVMEAISENDVVILAGETGSGKTTQVPQFLYEAGYAEEKLIGITEPRRVAAISMSKRVAEEMNLSQDVVSYLIRFEGNTTAQTKVKFMTDGVLLKEMERDFGLSKYSVIILDEAHERSVYTDILLGLLSRVVPLRRKKGNPLKLVIMSATLRVSDFTENEKLFKVPPPVIKVETRQFPVTVHFNRVTESDYVKEACRKAVKIHSKLPEGGILIFLTGQQEVHHLVKRLRMKFPFGGEKKESPPAEEETSKQDSEQSDHSDDEFDMETAIRRMKKSRKRFARELSLPKINLDTYKLPGDDTEADLVDTQELEGNLSDDEMDPLDEEVLEMATSQPLWVLPLYSLLSSAKQERVFQPPPEGSRLCVVATNVAETSLTIPNIKYVIDCGRQKVRLYDPVTGVEAYVVKFTSKASANQRSGRAGRMGPGHCYRLYSSAVYNDEMPDFSVPDILKRPVDDIVLQMKSMGITKVVNFPFPSPPDRQQLEMAERRLKILGALEGTTDGMLKVTKLGETISLFPIAPRFGKMLALSNQHNLMPYTICIVAALSVQQVLLENNAVTREATKATEDADKWAKRRKVWAKSGHFLRLGDPMVLLRATGGAEYAGLEGTLPKFCQKNGLRLKAVMEIRKLRVQLTNQLNLNIPNVEACVDPRLEPPTEDQARLLRQILLAGMADRVARRVPMEDISSPQERNRLKRAYNTPEMVDPVFLNSSSVLAKELPEWIIYQEVYEVTLPEPKMFIRGITEIEPHWLPTYAATMCNFQEIADEKPRYNDKTGTVVRKMKVTFGRAAWELPDAVVDMPFGAETCKHFGMYLLSGEVFPSLATYTPHLLSTASSMIKSYSKIIPRVASFIKTLINRQITSKSKLMDIWKEDPKYLLSEYQQWLPPKLSMEISTKWPPAEGIITE